MHFTLYNAVGNTKNTILVWMQSVLYRIQYRFVYIARIKYINKHE